MKLFLHGKFPIIGYYKNVGGNSIKTKFREFRCGDVVIMTTAQLIQQSLNSNSAQFKPCLQHIGDLR